MSKEIKQVMENFVVVILKITCWGGEKALRFPELKGVNILDEPPPELIKLGTKAIIDPKAIRPFKNLRKNLDESLLDKLGVNFCGLIAIPKSRIREAVTMIEKSQHKWEMLKDQFRLDYDTNIQTLCDKWPDYESVIRAAVPDVNEPLRKYTFDYQLIELNPGPKETEERVENEVKGFTEELISEVHAAAYKFLQERLLGKDHLSIRTRPTLKTLRDKVDGLSFLHPGFRPVVDLFNQALLVYNDPVKGLIVGSGFLQIMAIIMVLADKDLLHKYGRGELSLSQVQQDIEITDPVLDPQQTIDLSMDEFESIDSALENHAVDDISDVVETAFDQVEEINDFEEIQILEKVDVIDEIEEEVDNDLSNTFHLEDEFSDMLSW